MTALWPDPADTPDPDSDKAFRVRWGGSGQLATDADTVAAGQQQRKGADMDG